MTRGNKSSFLTQSIYVAIKFVSKKNQKYKYRINYNIMKLKC